MMIYQLGAAESFSLSLSRNIPERAGRKFSPAEASVKERGYPITFSDLIYME